MNLLDLFVKIGVEDNATGPMEQLSAGMIAKGQIIATAITSAVRNAVSAIQGLVQSAIGSYASYEQQVGGMQTFFGKAADTVIQNAKNAYDTAGMSANQYMSNVSGFAMTLINSVAKRRQSVTKHDTSAQKEALKTQLSDLQSTLSKQYSARQRELANEQRQLQRALDAEVQARSEANEEALERRSDALDEEYDRLSDTLEEEVEAYQKATDARIKEIDREYTEGLKLIDKEEYDRIKAIDSQIDALERQTKAENDARKKREQQQKLADLRETAATAKYAEDKAKAERDLQDLIADMAQEEREESRSVQIEKLKDDKQAIKDRADQQRDELKERHDAQKDSWREERSEGLKELRKTNSDRLEEQRKANQKELRELRKANQREIQAMRETNQTILDEASERSRVELENLSASNDAKIAEAQRYATEYAKAMDDAGEASGGFVKATAEDQAKAAEIADMAMRDMADNANKTGTNIGMLQNAYQGFSRQNFTMLDNLSLGYKGTTDEMERLLSDAEGIKAKTGEVVDYSIDSFADIVEAIHVIQEETGITGTTADEGATTIEGAMNRAKAAWDNWLVAIASGNEDVGPATETMATTIADAAALIIPRVGEILQTLFEVVQEKAPQIWETFKTEMMNALPDEWKEKLQGFMDMLSGFAEKIPEIIDTVKGLATAFVAFEVVTKVAGFISNLTTIFGPLVTAIGGAVTSAGGFSGVIAAVGAVLTGPVGIIGIIAAVVAAIVGFVASNEDAQKFLKGVWDNISSFVGGALDGLVKGVQGAAQGIMQWFGDLPQNIVNLFSGAGDWLVNAGENILNGLWNGLQSAWKGVTEFVGGIGDWIVEHKGPAEYDKKLLVGNGRLIMESLHGGLERGFEGKVMPYVSGMADAMSDAFGNPVLSTSVNGPARGATAQQTYQQPRQLNVILELDRTQFGRLVYELNEDETQRVGVRLAGGVA